MSGGIAVGQVVRPWGREGAVVVEPLTHDPQRFARLREIFLRSDAGAGRPVQLLRIDRTGRPIVRIGGVQSISEAELLRGEELLVPEHAAERPSGDAWFVHELRGTTAETEAGEVIGLVEDVAVTGAGDLLVVRGEHGEVLVPLTREIVVAVDVEARKVVVAPPSGLLELNREQEEPCSSTS